MSIHITDGTGKGYRAAVSNEGRLETASIAEPHEFHINEEGKYWSVPFGPQDPAGANDYVFYFKNTGAKDLQLAHIRLSCTGAASCIQINQVTGTAAGGSAITPMALNLASTNTPTATLEEGTDITGLTSSGTLFFMELAAVSTVYALESQSSIIVPKNQAIGILVETATSIVTGTVGLQEKL